MSLKLLRQTPAERKKRSLVIQKRLFGLNEFQGSKKVCFYVSMPAEVNTLPMIDKALKTKKVFVPVCDPKNVRLRFYEIKSRKDLKKGFFNICEPVTKGKRPVNARLIDCVIVPGLAFDRKNNRLGRGKGYYDKFLKKLPKKTKKIGLGFLFQMVDKVPVEKHDQKLDKVITD